MGCALFLSPHLDDVAFSCGGIAARLADAGWRTVLATCFTRSIHPATGFALACQLDKGLAPDIDYMALRRAEDARAAAILGFAVVRHLDLPEAPHRGYVSAPALFGAYAPEDDIAPVLEAALRGLLLDFSPTIVFAPQALGGHVDHHRLADAVAAIGTPTMVWYRDTPYAMRVPATAATDHDVTVDIGPSLARKIKAAQAYGSQIGFQFGGPSAAADALRAFAEREAGRHGGAAERVIGPVPADLHREPAM